MTKSKLKSIPIVGKEYHFWDDGKTSPSRHYICKVERIITPEEAKNIIVRVPHWDFEKKENFFVEVSLYDHWHDDEMPNHAWIFESETDYFVEASCPKYDENNLWFVRTKDGGWFSIDVQSDWQSGDLDIDNSIYEDIINEVKTYKNWEEIVKAYESETY